MNRLILQNTSTAQWHMLVVEAQDRLGDRLNIDLESYLVFVLDRFTNKPDLIQSILATDYLESLETTGKQRIDRLRDVGDKCILFTGFFPDLANKRHVTMSYFVDLGRRAYNNLSAHQKLGQLTMELYLLLRTHFIKLVDLLLSIRDLSGEQEVLTVVQAEDLWRNTGSRYAYQYLTRQRKKIISTSSLRLNDLH